MKAIRGFRRFSRLGRLLLASTAAFGLLAASPEPAQAASGDPGTISGAAPFRTCPDTRCGKITTIAKGKKAPVVCWRDAGATQGSPRWFRVTYAGRQGYVHSSLIAQPQPTVPYCSSLISGETLWSGQKVWALDGLSRLEMGANGNLMLYIGSSLKWASGTSGKGAVKAVLRTEGRLTLYKSDGGSVWSNGMRLAGLLIKLNNGGDLVAYSGSTKYWSTRWHTYRGQAAQATNPGLEGNCTWYAADRWMRYWDAHKYPALSGDARMWNNSASSLNYDVTGTPTAHSIVVFEAGVQGAGTAGHVAWVESVERKSTGIHINIKEMNWGTGNLGKVTSRTVKDVPGMNYIPAPKLAG